MPRDKNPAAPRQEIVDFSRSLPPRVPGLHADLATALHALTEKRDLAELTYRSVPRGSEADRSAGSTFVQPRFGAVVEPSRVIVTNGTQNALIVLLKTLVGVNGLLLAERLSYGVLRAVARWADVRIASVDLDSEGIIPEAFEAACRSQRPRALYCNPTIHNPTTAVMSENRRLALIQIARRYEVAIIEDDALGRLHSAAPPAIAALAPDVCWYVMTTTKCLAQGFRLAYVVAPSGDVVSHLLGSIEHLSFWHPVPLSCAIITQWIESGTADLISAHIAQECTARERVARQILDGLNARSAPGSMHVWLELPARWRAADFVTAAESRRVLVRSADRFAIDDQPTPNAVRLSLSPPADLDEVARGLMTIRDLIDEKR